MDALNEYALWGGIALFSGREHLHPESAQLQTKYDTVVKRAGKSIELPDHNRADQPFRLGRDIVQLSLKNRTILPSSQRLQVQRRRAPRSIRLPCTMRGTLPLASQLRFPALAVDRSREHRYRQSLALLLRPFARLLAVLLPEALVALLFGKCDDRADRQPNEALPVCSCQSLRSNSHTCRKRWSEALQCTYQVCWAVFPFAVFPEESRYFIHRHVPEYLFSSYKSELTARTRSSLRSDRTQSI